MSSSTTVISTPPSSSNRLTELPSPVCFPDLPPSDHGPSPMTTLTFFKGPSRQTQAENLVRKSICFGFLSNPQQLKRSADRPRVVTNWKSESETQREIANSLDQPALAPIHRFSSCSQTGERIEPLNLKSIPAEVLLPFNQRETEICELLTEKQNVGLYNRLKDRLGSNFAKLENDLLRASRSEMGDREWIMAIRALIQPLDDNLWVSFRGLMGADGLDNEQDTNAALEHGWHVQPFKVRRSSFRSTESRRRTDPSVHNRSFSEPSLSVYGGESDLDSISVVSQSPRVRMESIQEQEGLEVEASTAPLEECPVLQNGSDSDDEEPDDSHVLAIKILDGPSAVRPVLSNEGNTENSCCFLPHGLKYSFGQVLEHGLGLRFLNVVSASCIVSQTPWIIGQHLTFLHAVIAVGTSPHNTHQDTLLLAMKEP
ncbi:hypothetical protein VP01_1367g10 [Puccinia sorghi]|uniref:Uncharacterized protein n=1 Tax=Puccinia sorghi TaxID=27349 RepID=A0A0L6VLZ5_9BASI|nr:hypothetical protein VP01_1367g10 [Puccinia sorghi]